jgi:hypothetical protein
MLLLLKATLSPALIGIASWVGRRWGASAGGWCAALPLTSGPVMVAIALERGPAFAAQASLGTLLALISLAAFILIYAWIARRASWRWSSLAGCAAYLACTAALRDVSISLPLAFAIVCLVLLATLRVMPAPAGVMLSRASRSVRVWWDIPLRMLLAAILVITLTSIADTLGPRLSGLLTPFPIAVTILAAFTQHFEGPDAAARLLRGLAAGLFSFAMFFLVAGLAITLWSVTLTFTVATLTALACHAAAGALKGEIGAAVVHRWRVARGI